MSNLTAFRLTQGFYWLGLGVWVGALVMLVIAAAITFRTVRAYAPTLGAEPYNHPALADRAAPILAGGIVGNVLKGLATLQWVCAAVVVVCVVLQMTVFRDRMAACWVNGVRLLLIALPIVILALDTAVISPRIWQHRVVMYNGDNARSQRDAAHSQFMKYHKLSERLVGSAMFMLMGAVLLSPFALRDTAAPPAPVPSTTENP